MEKTTLHTGTKPLGPYSPGLRTPGFLFISGQLPLDPATGSLAAVPIDEQCRIIMKSIGVLLEKAGMTYHNLVKTTIFLTDLKDFTAVNTAYQEFLSEPYPARSTVQVVALPLGSVIEIEAIAQG